MDSKRTELLSDLEALLRLQRKNSEALDAIEEEQLIRGEIDQNLAALRDNLEQLEALSANARDRSGQGASHHFRNGEIDRHLSLLRSNLERLEALPANAHSASPQGPSQTLRETIEEYMRTTENTTILPQDIYEHVTSNGFGSVPSRLRPQISNVLARMVRDNYLTREDNETPGQRGFRYFVTGEGGNALLRSHFNGEQPESGAIIPIGPLRACLANATRSRPDQQYLVDMLARATWHLVDPFTVDLNVYKGSDFHREQLHKKENYQLLERVISDVLKKPINLVINVFEGHEDTGQ